MAQAVRHVGVTEGYDAWAETYNADGNPLIAVEEACGAVQQLDVRGKVVADIGTGTGRHLVSLLERGAALAIGLDGSAGMLARAEMSVKQVHHVPASRSRLVQHDLLQTPWPLETGSCDVVLCSLVLEHMTPTQLPTFFQEVARICRDSESVFLMTVQHPSLNFQNTTARFTDPDGKKVIVGTVPTNRTSDYIREAIDAGLSLSIMGEHGPRDYPDLTERVPRAAKYLGQLNVLTLQFSPHGGRSAL